MLVLLPPSETKRDPGDQTDTLKGLTMPESGLTRSLWVSPARLATCAEVLEALQTLSTNPDTAAYKTLKLRPGTKADRAFTVNLTVAEADTQPAVLLYTGVLYDALGVQEMGAAELQWLCQSVAIQSALYGLVPAAAPLANYRLSAASRLPDLQKPLKRVWQSVYAELRLPDDVFVLDLRSNDYAELAPLNTTNLLKPGFAQRQEDGSLRRLNHFNKAGKGSLVALLAQQRPNIRDTAEFLAWCNSAGIETVTEAATGQVTLLTTASGNFCA